MKQILLLFGIVTIFSILLTGGFTLKDPQIFNTIDTYVAELIDEGSLEHKTLQIKALKAVTPTPSPTSTPGPLPTSGQATPTPTPTGTSSITPFCPTKRVVVDLLLDTSGSMNSNQRINKLIQAVDIFPSSISSNVVVGVQEFNDYTYIDRVGYTHTRFLGGAGNILNIGPYNQGQFTNAINGLIPRGNTHMRDGFELALSEILAAKNSNRYQSYEWYLILLTDGIPNDARVGDPSGFIPGYSGPDESQNPVNPPSIVDQLIANNVKIITIGLEINALASERASYSIPAAQVPSYARDLLQNRMGPERYYEPQSPDELQTVYQSIAREVICGQP